MKINYIPLLISLVFVSCIEQQKTTQNPSPMEEHIRPHIRIDDRTCDGEEIELEGVFEHPITLFIPNHMEQGDTIDLAIHFHGNAKVIDYGTCESASKMISAAINLGSGSSRYEQPLLQEGIFEKLLLEIQKELEERDLHKDKLIISGFSAGYGAARAILGNVKMTEDVDAVLLLDGLHTDYIPEGMTLYQGGALNETKLKPFLDFAQKAIAGKKKMLITHSSIFPGAYASTTECSEHIINGLNLERKPVLLHGPGGMQQVGTTEEGNLKIWAFAGNTAPDHMDHLHGYYHFISTLLE